MTLSSLPSRFHQTPVQRWAGVLLWGCLETFRRPLWSISCDEAVCLQSTPLADISQTPPATGGMLFLSRRCQLVKLH